MGSLIKGPISHRLGTAPSDIFHVTIMPCYDKKLEAARTDFNVPGSTTPEVDTVLTTGELFELIGAALTLRYGDKGTARGEAVGGPLQLAPLPAARAEIST